MGYNGSIYFMFSIPYSAIKRIRFLIKVGWNSQLACSEEQYNMKSLLSRLTFAPKMEMMAPFFYSSPSAGIPKITV